jgi:hypothetical protein
LELIDLAFMEFKLPQEYEKLMNKLGDLYDDASEEMLSAGAGVVANALRGTKFGKYVKIKKPKKNQYGWFAQVQFKGRVKSGTKAAIAATVYEFGRGGRAPQPARPQIRTAAKGAEGAAVKAMQDVLEAKLQT